MYQAKVGASGAIVMYSGAMSARLRDWLDLEGRLRRAVQEEKLELYYQPKFRLSDNRLVGVEALLRWCDAEHGEIPPTRFIEIAEDSGLIIDLGAWVIRAVCRQLRAWQDAGHSIPVAINVSGKELLHGDPAWTLEAEARAAGVPISLIEVEMTESVLVKDSARVRTALQRLRQLGCRIALDDFGTGYSSLAYITRFPPDRIKIDKAFVRLRHRQCHPVTRRQPERDGDGRGRRAPRATRLAAQARLPRGAGLLVVEAPAGARVRTAISVRRYGCGGTIPFGG
jgi:EAL domain-containing protein (putative c-di-GMP-specific phosphodiesterase class I)